MTAVTKRNECFAEASIDDEIVIMRVDTGEFISLSGTAAAIWRLIDGHRSRAGLLSALADEYSASEEVIAADVDEFLAQLRESGLLDGG